MGVARGVAPYTLILGHCRCVFAHLPAFFEILGDMCGLPQHTVRTKVASLPARGCPWSQPSWPKACRGRTPGVVENVPLTERMQNVSVRGVPPYSHNQLRLSVSGTFSATPGVPLGHAFGRLGWLQGQLLVGREAAFVRTVCCGRPHMSPKSSQKRWVLEIAAGEQ